ncbi:MAG: hypothetical protein JOZ08_09230 [Verrucomicrobia bacterium]|nr:hypothetical protein [Verrucomicrobiota bacterium]MBV8278674.1 hypothetical protein [Verrucomicrobiota bacterium]
MCQSAPTSPGTCAPSVRAHGSGSGHGLLVETVVQGLSEDENRFLVLSAELRDKREQEKEQQRQRELEATRNLAETERRRAEAEHKRAERERELRLRGIALALASYVKQGIETRERSLLLARQAYLFGGAEVSDQTDAAFRAVLERETVLVALRGPPGERPVALRLSADGRFLGRIVLWQVRIADMFIITKEVSARAMPTSSSLIPRRLGNTT